AALLAQMNVVEEIQFHPPAHWRTRVAPTEDDPWRGRVLVGEVHDENASALGGAAGHAGLFGTVAAVGSCARHVLQVLGGRTGAFARLTLETFVTRRSDVPGSSRALGWDTMLPTSSCGTRLSSRAFGHTGFTGTSLWLDPEQNVYVAFLTNRVHPTRTNEAIRRVRPALHDAVIADLGYRPCRPAPPPNTPPPPKGTPNGDPGGAPARPPGPNGGGWFGFWPRPPGKLPRSPGTLPRPPGGK